jgi:hypothetical protein
MIPCHIPIKVLATLPRGPAVLTIEFGPGAFIFMLKPGTSICSLGSGVPAALFELGVLI